MRSGQAHKGVHQSTMLGGHGEEDLFEWVGVIIDEGQNATEIVDKMIKESPVDIGFDAVNQQREGTRDNQKRMGSNR